MEKIIDLLLGLILSLVATAATIIGEINRPASTAFSTHLDQVQPKANDGTKPISAATAP